jgi:hypothetical protein
MVNARACTLWQQSVRALGGLSRDADDMVTTPCLFILPYNSSNYARNEHSYQLFVNTQGFGRIRELRSNYQKTNIAYHYD